MEKLIRGIVEFHETKREGYAETFAQLALGQQPDALFIACSDSRVAVNVFASSDPGDLFVLRNVGNLVPPFGHPGGAGTAAAVDFAVDKLAVRNIIVCGHSDCGAMHAHCGGHNRLPQGALREWLDMAATGDPKGLDVNEASRQNVAAQLKHLETYPSVAHAIGKGRLRLHGLWFDIRHVDVLYLEADGSWIVIDAASAPHILARIDAR